MKAIGPLGFLAVLLFYVAWPLYAGYGIKSSLEGHNVEGLTSRIDFASVRVSLKPAVAAKVDKAMTDALRKAGVGGGGLTDQLKAALGVYRGAARALLTNHDSASENMQKLERGAVPGQLSFFITALAALGYEPVSLKFFTLQADGTLHYLDAKEIAALADTQARRKKKSWVDTDFSEAFTNSELTFRKAGDPKAPLVTHRHIAANLANNAFPGSPLAKHLEAKGKVATMTKAASYLLWLSNFSGIRDYLLAHSAWMISDSTGIPPRHARRAGFKQTTYGKFAGSYLGASAAENDAFRKLWEEQPRRKLKFRYGYPDSEGNEIGRAHV